MTNDEILAELRSCRIGVLAKLLGLSERRCRELATEHGWRVGRGQFDAVVAVSDYLSRNSEKAAVLDLAQERALLAKAQRGKLDLDMAERKAELLDAGDVSAAWADAWTRVRIGIEQLPARVIPSLMAAPAEYGAFHAILKREIHAELNRLATHSGYELHTADELTELQGKND